MHGDRPEPDRVLSHGMIDGVTHDKKLNCSQCQNKAQEESVRQCAGCCCAVARSGGQSRRGERAAAVPGRAGPRHGSRGASVAETGAGTCGDKR